MIFLIPHLLLAFAEAVFWLIFLLDDLQASGSPTTLGVAGASCWVAGEGVAVAGA